MCKALRVLIARNRPGLDINKQSTLNCWPRNQLPFTTLVVAVGSNLSPTRIEKFGDSWR